MLTNQLVPITNINSKLQRNIKLFDGKAVI